MGDSRLGEHLDNIKYHSKWILLATLVGGLVGITVAWFLLALAGAGHWRDDNLWILWFLPLGGFAIGWTYYKYGQSVEQGNNQLLEEITRPKETIPLRMAPLVALTTIATHLFGGSAGREGTGVQMGGAIADQFSKHLQLSDEDRRMLIITGISAGFSAVFGTPLAGAVFALEVYIIGRLKYEAIIPSFIAAIIANEACSAWSFPHPVHHTHYLHPTTIDHGLSPILYTIFAGIIFGWVAIGFAKLNHYFNKIFKEKISYPPLRPFIGGAILALTFFALSQTIGHQKFIGLGVPVIVQSFTEQMPTYDFAIKLVLTAFTLGCGFKGGEVTPLFFIGATCGSAMAGFIPLPLAMLAAIGFVGVFAGATNTPIACTLMGIELFGADIGIYMALACVFAYISSGHSSIYSSQVMGHAKYPSLNKHRGKKLHEKD